MTRKDNPQTLVYFLEPEYKACALADGLTSDEARVAQHLLGLTEPLGLSLISAPDSPTKAYAIDVIDTSNSADIKHLEEFYPLFSEKIQTEAPVYAVMTVLSGRHYVALMVEGVMIDGQPQMHVTLKDSKDFSPNLIGEEDMDPARKRFDSLEQIIKGLPGATFTDDETVRKQQDAQDNHTCFLRVIRNQLHGLQEKGVVLKPEIIEHLCSYGLMRPDSQAMCDIDPRVYAQFIDVLWENALLSQAAADEGGAGPSGVYPEREPEEGQRQPADMPHDPAALAALCQIVTRQSELLRQRVLHAPADQKDGLEKALVGLSRLLDQMRFAQLPQMDIAATRKIFSYLEALAIENSYVGLNVTGVFRQGLKDALQLFQQYAATCAAHDASFDLEIGYNELIDYLRQFSSRRAQNPEPSILDDVVIHALLEKTQNFSQVYFGYYSANSALFLAGISGVIQHAECDELLKLKELLISYKEKQPEVKIAVNSLLNEVGKKFAPVAYEWEKNRFSAEQAKAGVDIGGLKNTAAKQFAVALSQRITQLVQAAADEANHEAKAQRITEAGQCVCEATDLFERAGCHQFAVAAMLGFGLQLKAIAGDDSLGGQQWIDSAFQQAHDALRNEGRNTPLRKAYCDLLDAVLQRFKAELVEDLQAKINALKIAERDLLAPNMPPLPEAPVLPPAPEAPAPDEPEEPAPDSRPDVPAPEAPVLPLPPTEPAPDAPPIAPPYLGNTAYATGNEKSAARQSLTQALGFFSATRAAPATPIHQLNAAIQTWVSRDQIDLPTLNAQFAQAKETVQAEMNTEYFSTQPSSGYQFDVTVQEALDAVIEKITVGADFRVYFPEIDDLGEVTSDAALAARLQALEIAKQLPARLQQALNAEQPAPRPR